MPYIIRLVGRAGFEPATIRFPRCALGRLGDAYLWQASTASPSAWTRVKLTRKLYQAELPPVARPKDREIETDILTLIQLAPLHGFRLLEKLLLNDVFHNLRVLFGCIALPQLVRLHVKPLLCP